MDAATRAVDTARLNLIAALAAREETAGPVRRRLEDRFYVEFGELHVREYRLFCHADRQRFRLKLIQKDLEAGLAVRREAIDAQIADQAEDDAEQVRRLEELCAMAAKRHRMAGLFDGQSLEHVRLFRDIAGKMSPDVYPQMAPDKVQLYEEGLQAFRDENVHGLQMIHAISRQLPMPPISGSIIALREERMRLEERLREVQAETRLVQTEFPFDYREILDDPKCIERNKEERRYRIMELQRTLAVHQQMIAQLLGARENGE